LNAEEEIRRAKEMVTEVRRIGAEIRKIRKQMGICDQDYGSDGKAAGRIAPFGRRSEPTLQRGWAPDVTASASQWPFLLPHSHLSSLQPTAKSVNMAFEFARGYCERQKCMRVF
jgi:hypothetical protein